MTAILKSRRFWTLLLLFGLLLSFGVWRISKAKCYQLVGDVTCRAETHRKIVALSFDDGPEPGAVSALLPLLELYKVKATFFVIGREMRRHPGLAKQIAMAGHEIGNHSLSHKRNLFKSAAFYKNEVEANDRLLKAEGIDNVTLFRPPFGKRLIGLPIAVENAGLRMTTWDVGADPAKAKDARDYARILAAKVRPGSIILMHPMYGHNQRELEAVPFLIEELRSKGYEIMPVSALLSAAARPE